MRLGGIQPVYLPWLGYFDQIRRVDRFLIADEMPYSTSAWTHRNRIKGPDGPIWLTLPVRAERGQPICDVRLDTRVPWVKKHMKTLRHCYGRGAEATETLGRLEAVLDPKAERVVDVCIPTIRFLAEELAIDTPIDVSSDLGLEARYIETFPDQPGPTERIVAYMRELGTDQLLEGASGRTYFDTELFESNGFSVEFHDYEHPHYEQPYPPFVTHLSALDLLLSVGRTRARAVFAGEAV